MTTLLDLYKKYDCDKGTTGKHPHHYHTAYEKIFESKKDEPINFLEVGVWWGTSFNAHLEYFPNAQFYGIDIFTRVAMKDVKANENDRVHLLKADSTKSSVTDAVRKEWGDIKFDFIIDDGLHTPDANRLTFKHLFPLLKEDGTFLIEDVWPLDKLNFEELNHEWIKNKPAYSLYKYKDFVSHISANTVKAHDLRKMSGLLDSYIFEITK
jgi:cephalosporin hydroxylase